MEEEIRPRKKGGPNTRLKQEREKRFWTLEDVSARISMLPDFAPGEPDPRTVGRWERGISFPSPRYCRALCSVFSLDAQALGLLDEDQEEQEISAKKAEPDVEIIPQTPTPPHIESHLACLLVKSEPSAIVEKSPQDERLAIPAIPGLINIAGLPRQSLQQWSRQRLIKRLRTFWISHMFAQSFQDAPPISLRLTTRPDAVVNPWHGVIQESRQVNRHLPAGTSLKQCYAEADGALLLLGEAGGGKTTLLLSLAEALLERAEQDQYAPVPVIFVLSTWQTPQHSLRDWLLEELEQRYEIPRAIADHWLHTGQMILLLDSLDETSKQKTSLYIQHINQYRRAFPFVPLVICCRKTNYLAQPERLHLQQAVQIETLHPEQVEDYLTEAGPPLVAIREAFRHLPTLREFVTTPLRLSIMAHAWHHISSPEDLRNAWSDGSAQQQLCASYAQRVLTRRGIHPHYTPQQTLRWLAQLARTMQPVHPHFPERNQGSLSRQWLEKIYQGFNSWLAETYLHKRSQQSRKAYPTAKRGIAQWQATIPWQHRQFLDYATECQLLSKEEKGYDFAHSLLRDYFAQWDDQPDL